MSNKLNCYASGSGSLSFVWIDKETNQCVNRRVTKTDVKRYVASQKKQGKKIGNWIIFDLGKEWQLVAPIKRLSESMLEVEKEVFEYSVNKEGGDSEIRWHHLTVWKEDETRRYEVKHISTRSSILFYLNHEAEIVKAMQEATPVS